MNTELSTGMKITGMRKCCVCVCNTHVCYGLLQFKLLFSVLPWKTPAPRVSHLSFSRSAASCLSPISSNSFFWSYWWEGDSETERETDREADREIKGGRRKAETAKRYKYGGKGNQIHNQNTSKRGSNGQRETKIEEVKTKRERKNR